MAMELCQLIEKVQHKDITLLAGEKGMHNFVSWVHMVESLEASTFLEGGEIAFTTGIGLGGSFSILDLVEVLYRNRVAAVVINIGPFIESIPEEVISFGNRHDFPIFSVPWKIHVAEIIQIICYAITKSDQKDMETAAAFKNAIFFPKQEELYVIPLSQLGFQVNWNYYVCAIKVMTAAGDVVSFNRLEEIRTDMNDFFRYRRHETYAVFHNENQVVIVIGNYDKALFDRFSQDLGEYTSGHLRKNEECCLGIGKCTKSIRCLNKSYAQALAIQRLHEHDKIEKDLVAYANLGMYKLLLGIEDREILEEFYSSTLKPLIEYDERNGTDLSMVLRVYLKHDGSVKSAADELFVHRNTVNYKISKTAEVLGTDMSLLDTRLKLLLCFMLHDILS
jgi:hypothetical protein